MISFRESTYLSIAALIPPFPFVPVPVDDSIIEQLGFLRDYQMDMIYRVADAMRAGYRRVLLVLPTGAGKTQIAAAIMAACQCQEITAQFLVHRRELIKQTSTSFSQRGVSHGFAAAGFDFRPESQILLGGIQTVAKRLAKILPPDLTIVDEAHHSVSPTYSGVLDSYDGFVLGLTATPERLDGKGLGTHYDCLIVGPSTADLIEWGYLSDFDYFAPTNLDTSGLATQAGDFARDQAALLVDKPKLIGDIVEHYIRLAKGMKGIVFAASREHSRHIADEFRTNGITAAHIDGAMSDDERNRIDAGFREGEFDILSNVDLLGEGYDVPNVSYVGLGRPSKSLCLIRQQAGRALRLFPGKTGAVICDHTNNAERVGLPDQEIEWSLLGKQQRLKSASAADAFPTRTCKTCYRVSPSSFTVCPGCDTPFGKIERELKIEEGELQKIEREKQKKREQAARKAEEQRCGCYNDWLELGRKRGVKNPENWARMKRKFQTNYRPRQYG